MNKGTLVEVKASIRSLLVSSTSSMSIQDLQRDFKRFMGTPLPYVSLGYGSAEMLLRALPDVVRVIGYGPQAVVQYVPNVKSEHIADFVKNQKTTTNRRRKCVVNPRARRWQPLDYNNTSEDSNEDVYDFGRLSMNDYRSMPSGNYTISSPSLSSSNESEGNAIKISTQVGKITTLQRRNENQRQQTSLPKRTLSSNELNKSCDTMKTTNEKNIVINKRFNITYSSTEELKEPLNNSQANKLTTKSEVNSICLGTRYYPIKEIHNTNNDAVPEDAMTEIIENFGVQRCDIDRQHTTPKPLEIPECKLFEELKEGSIISLYISEIHNPLTFFFHIDQEGHELIKLEEQMQDLYSIVTSNDVNMPISYLQPGRICAARNGNIWYRAKILSVPNYLTDFSKIKVLFIDYGCVDQISIKHLKVLAPIFFDVPIQAARGRLAQIQPNERIRSVKAINYFASLVNDRCLYAYVTKIDKDTPSFELILIDTNEQPRCNINETLLKSGFATKAQITKS